MAQINGTVVAVEIDVPVKKNGGGTYQGWSLVYKDNTGEIKTMSKHMNSLKYAQPLKNGLESLKAGDAFTLEQEKEGDFWNPKSIYKSKDVPAMLKGDVVGAKPAYTAPGSSTYSTVEERAQTQKYIVRQSSLTNALKLLELRGEKKVGTNEVIAIAETFEAFVMNYEHTALADSSKVKHVAEDIADLDDDIPF